MYIVYGIPVKRKDLLFLFQKELQEIALMTTANQRRWYPRESNSETKFVRDLCKLLDCSNSKMAIDIFNEIVNKNTSSISHFGRRLFSYPEGSDLNGDVWIYGAGVCTDLIDIDTILAIEDFKLQERYKQIDRGVGEPKTFILPSY